MASFNKNIGIMRAVLRTGEPFIFGVASCVALVLMMVAIMLGVIMYNGLGVFWPSTVQQIRLNDGTSFYAEVIQRNEAPDNAGYRIQLKTGNRDLYGLDFRWVLESEIKESSTPAELIVLERMEYGNFYGTVAGVIREGVRKDIEWKAFYAEWLTSRETVEAIQKLDQEIKSLAYASERMRKQRIKTAYYSKIPVGDVPVSNEEVELQGEFAGVLEAKEILQNELKKTAYVFADANGKEKELNALQIVRPYQPNLMGTVEKAQFYLAKLKELFWEEPRESNTEGGLFPAIFGTVLLVFLMSLLSFPLGVIAGVYLKEYAKDGLVLQLVRIAVNNLAGVPSIVYGIFGLGFFVYGIGGSIDRLFFPESLPTPTYGTGGILWASLTLGLLTVPVVIVATEEALGAIPGGIRQGSYAMGATQFQTLVRLLLPMASPGIMTGFILAMARAAGEVAPLMITGVVKLAPTLAVSGEFPFFHPERKFMHLGFHIYDIGFQSPNVEAAKPMVFVTALLLVLIVLLMSSAAIYLRNKMKKKYTITSI